MSRSSITKIPTGRMMAFIDGDNFAIRFKELKKKNESSWNVRPEVQEEEDIFAWHSGTIQADQYEVIRATYYTFCSGDRDAMPRSIEEKIKNLPFEQYINSIPSKLTPLVQWKPKQSDKSPKSVDMQMITDVLGHVYSDHVDAVYIVTHDADFLPLVEAISKNGKQVYVAGFESEFSRNALHQYKTIADKFISLHGLYFEEKNNETE